MSMNTDNHLLLLHTLICEAFTIDELRHEICLELQENLEDISGKSDKKTAVYELICYFDRRNDLERLVEKCREKRPNCDWSQFPAGEEENIEGNRPTVFDKLGRTSDFPSKKPGHPKNKEQWSSEESGRITISEPSSNWRKINTLTEKLALAEKDGDVEAVANTNAKLATLFKQEKRYVQARNCARKSANYFLKANKKGNAVEQYLYAAKIWINHTALATTTANHDLEKAEKIASELNNFTLLARVFLLQAQYGILRGTRQHTEKMWQQVESLLSKIRPDHQIEISTELAIQKAVIARLDGKIETVINLLKEADKRDWPVQSISTRLELLWCMLFFYSESGNWQEVDRIYNNVQELLNDRDESQYASWLMHFAASLARRGEAEKALDAYHLALPFFQGEKATLLQKHDFFQNMQYTLLRHAGLDIFSSAMKYDTERLDLALNVLHEDIGYLHITRARREYFEGKIEEAFIHAQFALMYAWRKGDWSGLSEANKILVSLYGFEEEYVSATFVAINTAQDKTIEKYASHLNNLSNPDEVRYVIDSLIQEWPTRADLEGVLVAISQCTDIVPPDRLEQVIQYLIDVLQQYLPNEFASNTCQSAIKVLRLLAPQLDQPQTQEIVQLSTEILYKPIHWTIKREAIQLIGACFYNKRLQLELYSSATEAILLYRNENVLQTETDVALLHIAINAPSQVRHRITTLFREHSNWNYLAILKEPILDKTVEAYIENILRSITPHRKNGSISYSGQRARSINNFNEYITLPFGNFVIDGLLAAIRNPEGFLTQKSDAILTLRWLPDDILKERANEIGQFLLQVIKGKHINSEVNDFLNWFGNEEDVRRNGLYTLGRLLSLVDNSLKKQIYKELVFLSRSKSSTIRMGVAMSLRALGNTSSKLPPDLTFVLIELLQDENPQIRHWAASAAGHRIVEKQIPKNTSRFLIQRLLQAAKEETNVHARAGVAYGLRILLESDNLSKPLREQVQQARNRLSHDLNYQVRKMAAGQ